MGKCRPALDLTPLMMTTIEEIDDETFIVSYHDEQGKKRHCKCNKSYSAAHKRASQWEKKLFKSLLKQYSDGMLLRSWLCVSPCEVGDTPLIGGDRVEARLSSTRKTIDFVIRRWRGDYMSSLCADAEKLKSQQMDKPIECSIDSFSWDSSWSNDLPHGLWEAQKLSFYDKGRPQYRNQLNDFTQEVLSPGVCVTSPAVSGTAETAQGLWDGLRAITEFTDGCYTDDFPCIFLDRNNRYSQTVEKYKEGMLCAMLNSDIYVQGVALMNIPLLAWLGYQNEKDEYVSFGAYLDMRRDLRTLFFAEVETEQDFVDIVTGSANQKPAKKRKVGKPKGDPDYVKKQIDLANKWDREHYSIGVTKKQFAEEKGLGKKGVRIVDAAIEARRKSRK